MVRTEIQLSFTRLSMNGLRGTKKVERTEGQQIEGIVRLEPSRHFRVLGIKGGSSFRRGFIYNRASRFHRHIAKRIADFEHLHFDRLVGLMLPPVALCFEPHGLEPRIQTTSAAGVSGD